MYTAIQFHGIRKFVKQLDFSSSKLTKPKAMKKSWKTSVYATETKPPNNVYTTAIIALMTIDMVFSI